jgi:hypothetical protein
MRVVARRGHVGIGTTAPPIAAVSVRVVPQCAAGYAESLQRYSYGLFSWAAL